MLNWELCAFFSYRGTSYKGRWHLKNFFSCHCAIKIKSWSYINRKMLNAPYISEPVLSQRGLKERHYWHSDKKNKRQSSPNLGPDGPAFSKLAQIQGLGTPKYLSMLSLSYHCTGFAEVLAVLPPFPITLPAAKDGTLIWASSFTSSLGLTKFSSLIFP